MNEELALEETKIQVEILRRNVNLITPSSGDYGGNVQFEVHNNTLGSYVDVNNVLLEVEMELKKSAREPLTYTDNKISVVNNLFHSLWTNVTATINHKVVTESDHTDPYQAYLYKLLSYSPSTLEVQGQLFGWVKDAAGAMDTTTIERAAATDIDKKKWAMPDNPVYARNKWWFTNLDSTKTDYLNIRLIDKPLVIPFTQSKYLPFGYDMILTFERANQAFSLLADSTTNPQRNIISARLHVPYVIRNRVLHTPISVGTTSHHIANLFTAGSLQQKVIIGLVNNAAQAGQKQKNPFNLKHFNLAQIQLFKNGKPFPNQPIRLKFDSSEYKLAYIALLGTIGHTDITWRRTSRMRNSGKASACKGLTWRVT